MDPDAALTEARQIAGDLIDCEGQTADPDDALRLAELFRGLDQWLGSGGFLPSEWRADRC